MLEGISLFSGIGGIDCGMKLAGIRPILSVELDIENRVYSEECQKMNEINFPESDFYLNQVQDVVDQLPPCDLLQASPVCRNFSGYAAMNAWTETLADTQMAGAIAKAIERTNCPHFLLEQVPDYTKSRSYEKILDTLQHNSFHVNPVIVDAADYGVAQNRKRLFLLASKLGRWELPPTQKRMGWKEAIAGAKLIHKGRIDKALTDRQKERVREVLGKADLTKGLLIERVVNGQRSPIVRLPHEPCWTLTRNAFGHKRKGRSRPTVRNSPLNVIYGTEVYDLPIRAVARLAGFPDWFQFGEFGGMGIGYSVPPRLAAQLFGTLPHSQLLGEFK